MQDLWHVEVVVRFQEYGTQTARYIIRTNDPADAEEAAALACVQVMYRTGLPNGEHPYVFDGTALSYRSGKLEERGYHTLVWDKDAKTYRHETIKGIPVGPDPDNAEMIQYNWRHRRWDGPSR